MSLAFHTYMGQYRRLIILSIILVIVAWVVGYNTYFVMPEEQDFVAVTQSVSSPKERYVWFDEPEYARIVEESIDLERFPDIWIDALSRRVFEKAEYPLVRITSSATKNELQTIFAPYDATFIERVPEVSVFTDWSLPLVKNMQECLWATDTLLGIVDTHFWTESEKMMKIYYVTDPGQWKHGDIITLLAWWAASVWIDASENDSFLPYAFEWIVLAQYLWVERLLLWWWSIDGYTESYKAFITRYPDIKLISPMSSVKDDWYPAWLSGVIGISEDELDELICVL